MGTLGMCGFVFLHVNHCLGQRPLPSEREALQWQVLAPNTIDHHPWLGLGPLLFLLVLAWSKRVPDALTCPWKSSSNTEAWREHWSFDKAQGRWTDCLVLRNQCFVAHSGQPWGPLVTSPPTPSSQQTNAALEPKSARLLPHCSIS